MRYFFHSAYFLAEFAVTRAFIWSCRPFEGTQYVDDTFAARAVATVTRHNAKNTSSPLFLFWAPHAAHSPLQVPQASLDRFADIQNPWWEPRDCARLAYNVVQFSRLVLQISRTSMNLFSRLVLDTQTRCHRSPHPIHALRTHIQSPGTIDLKVP